MTKRNKLEHGNLLYRLFYGFMFEIFKKGNKRPLEESDLKELNDSMMYKHNSPKFKEYYHKKRDNLSLIKITLRWIFPIYIWQVLDSLYADLVGVGTPFILKELIDWIQNYNDPSISTGE